MAVVVPAPPALSGDLALFHTTDPLLANSPVLIFHGPAATIGATSSRIQVHVFTPAGVGSYSRLAVSPTSPLYSAVNNLPRDEQGDEVCRGLAFGLKKYFTELPETVKKTWCAQAKAPSPAMLFGNDHIAVLASRMTRIENIEEVIGVVEQAFGEQRQSWLDVDVVLPPGSIKETAQRTSSAESDDAHDQEQLEQRYGRHAELVATLGDATFLPTSNLKRAPSKPTSVGRSSSFLRHQKENVRKELCELVETEESYVDRLKELQDLSAHLGGDLKAASQQRLRSVFPDALSSILELNTTFLSTLRALLDATEPIAVADIQATSESQTSAEQSRQDLLSDTQGIGAIAKCLCEWLPQFGEAYGPYLKSQSDCSQYLRSLLRSSDTALVAELQEAGEQRLTSLLIEPVQRLPRYTLYIDSITKQLPVRHPAITHLLKARDIVTDICSQDHGAGGAASVVERLRTRVPDWPADCQLIGRLVTVVDYTALALPYALTGCEAHSGFLLLFTDGLVMLGKDRDCGLSAKSLHSELDGSALGSQRATTPGAGPQELRFLRRVQLDAFDCSESHNGRALQVFTRFELPDAARPAQQPTVDSCQILRLEAGYDGKATRLVEDITKARVEARFSEAEREGPKWDVRATDPAADHASLLCAVFEDSEPEHIAARRACAAVRVLVDIDKHSQRPRAGQNSMHTVVALSPLKGGLWRMTVDSVDGSATREHVSTPDLVLMLSKRLATLSSARLSIEQQSMTSCLLHKNADILRSIDLRARLDEDDSEVRIAAHEPSRRPKSPRKLFSTFLSSTGSGSQPPNFIKLPPLPPPTQMRPALAGMAPPKTPSNESRPTSKGQQTPKSTSSAPPQGEMGTSTKRLEDALSTYMLALQHRKGNIVGRNLKMRGMADELSVNELYNSLLEDPNMMVLAAQAAVDVLFAAFEKFLNVAWKEQIGQVVPYVVIQNIQSKAETMFPTDFDQYFRSAMTRLPPQNQRAFKGIMKLLADLLDGTGNDGDRGALTAAFAEVLVTEGNPHDFIALIDRFVDDTDTYFGEPLEESHKVPDMAGSAHKRARSTNSASLTSNSSSLRKRLGFSTMSRANSRAEEDSKVSSVWRTLSKSTRGDQSPASSISKGTLHRSQSTDMDGRVRPSSQDEPAILKPSPLDDVPSLNAHSPSNPGLTTIGEHPTFIPTGPPRKKRRSSLSDLRGMNDAQDMSAWMSPASRRSPLMQNSIDDKSLGGSARPCTPASKGGVGKLGSPMETPRSRLPASFKRENSPSANKAFGLVEPLRPRSSSKHLDEVIINSRATSSIPTLTPRSGIPQKASSPAPRTGLSERPDAGNIVRRPSPKPEKSTKSARSTSVEPSPPKRLRMQSPQKLRERLQNEHGTITASQTSLQDELSRIGDELTATPSRIGSVRATKSPGSRGIGGQQSNMELAQRILKMEGSLVKQGEELKTRIDGVQTDLSSSLTVSENKCKKLDELYREANGENEALYARFNDELGRILKAVRGGDGVEELKKKLKETQDEAVKLKRETNRLKRENVGLRAQLRE
ncbi:hypothetical protein B0A50_00428 [Salinomyces thailandicus]|uniref:DH domain-containing protein n=1 Tax=Salinomyces thailandicus TaxID=706561 RepID=A0A4U0UFC4_9PEZI|nr:hypothetical protein B0A50_00428 [Salinomyces thailandica]